MALSYHTKEFLTSFFCPLTPPAAFRKICGFRQADAPSRYNPAPPNGPGANKTMQRGKTKMRKAYFFGLALAVLIMTAGCGQKIKKENEELKSQVVALTGDKTTLTTQLSSVTQELEEAKTRITTLTSELDATKQELEVLKTKPKAKKKARR